MWWIRAVAGMCLIAGVLVIAVTTRVIRGGAALVVEDPTDDPVEPVERAADLVQVWSSMVHRGCRNARRDGGLVCADCAPLLAGRVVTS